MKRLAIVLGILAMGWAACAKEAPKPQPAPAGSKALVVYFSCTGTTKAVAERLAKLVGADLVEITPEKPYTTEDLDWHNKQSRSSLEMNDPKARPACTTRIANIGEYSIVYLGTPIWWGVAPRIINTFLDAHDLSGKAVAPFATSGSSSVNKLASELKKSYPKVEWKAGLLATASTDAELKAWAEKATK